MNVYIGYRDLPECIKQQVPLAAPSEAAGERCKYCGTPRIGTARFCGECGGEFK